MFDRTSKLFFGGALTVLLCILIGVYVMDLKILPNEHFDISLKASQEIGKLEYQKILLEIDSTADINAYADSIYYVRFPSVLVRE